MYVKKRLFPLIYVMQYLVIWLLLAEQRKRDLNQPKVDSFVSRMAKNNGENNSDRHKICSIFLTNCFALVIINT